MFVEKEVVMEDVLVEKIVKEEDLVKKKKAQMKDECGLEDIIVHYRVSRFATSCSS